MKWRGNHPPSINIATRGAAVSTHVSQATSWHVGQSLNGMQVGVTAQRTCMTYVTTRLLPALRAL